MKSVTNVYNKQMRFVKIVTHNNVEYHEEGSCPPGGRTLKNDRINKYRSRCSRPYAAVLEFIGTVTIYGRKIDGKINTR